LETIRHQPSEEGPIDDHDPRYWEVFFEIHTGLPREAPGDSASALRALGRVPDLPPDPLVLDLACGPGAATPLLARETGGRVVALDLHRPFLLDVVSRSKREEVTSRVLPVHANMEALPVGDERFDLVWCEGALYNMGFARGLEACRRILKPGGCLAATEVVWLEDDPPAEARAWWETEYPAIAGLGPNIRVIEESGLDLLGHFTLPEEAWWDYYRPIEERLTALRETHHDDPAALEVIDDAQLEIDMYRRHHGAYGYEFFICRK
jgi:ubiquinone/menaquinone biosynthesis C-methylase UbiE